MKQRNDRTKTNNFLESVANVYQHKKLTKHNHQRKKYARKDILSTYKLLFNYYRKIYVLSKMKMDKTTYIIIHVG